MSPQAWMCEKLILAAALALAMTPVSWAQTPAPLGNNTVEQATPKPPQVIYENGQLTIIAENGSLSDVMKALRAALGTDIDLPTNVADQRIWVHLGPGSPRGVLRELLDGTEFNYVIQASESDPAGIRSVLLTQRSKSTDPQAQGLPERAASRIPSPGSEPRDAADSENPARESAASADPSPATPPAPPASGSANSPLLPNTPVNAASSGLSVSPPTDREQQIQTLQSMYQQRKQLQMQQNQKAAGQN